METANALNSKARKACQLCLMDFVDQINRIILLMQIS